MHVAVQHETRGCLKIRIRFYKFCWGVAKPPSLSASCQLIRKANVEKHDSAETATRIIMRTFDFGGHSMDRLRLYALLVRAHKPIGILLAVAHAHCWRGFLGGVPDWRILVIYVLGTVLMRSAGCAINDYADRDFDRHVKRTEQRPLTSGKIKSWEALMVAGVLALVSFLLILPLNALTLQLSVAAVITAGSYPVFQAFLSPFPGLPGHRFGFGIPMGFASVTGSVPLAAWVLLVANIFWAVAYDTEYAMVDRDDDLKIGIKTSAITFGRHDVAGHHAVLRGGTGADLGGRLQYGLGLWFGGHAGGAALPCITTP
jgi:4-hydroxybenzoate polyprenyltransferase